MLELANAAAQHARGTTLTVCHGDALSAGTIWQRVWHPHRAATVWPPTGPFDTILLPLPRGKEAVIFCLHAVAGVLASGGNVLLFGHNDMGIKSANKAAQPLFSSIECIHTGNHGRIWKLANPIITAVKRSVDDFQRGTAPYVSYPGLFAGGKLDEATALLIDNLPPVPAGSKVMDFACGIGVVAAAVQRAQPECTITVIDNDPLALLATKHNVPAAAPQLIGDPAHITGTHDFIFSNPPIHEGNVQTFHIVHGLVTALPRLLNKGGAAFIVAQVTVPVARFAKDAGLVCTEVSASRSFRVSRITRS
jgi:16S rRNA (guanine1207-N2)-methyltransferase